MSRPMLAPAALVALLTGAVARAMPGETGVGNAVWRATGAAH